MSQLETGRYEPTTAVIERLFAALGRQVRVDVEALDADLDEVIAAGREQSDNDLGAALEGWQTLTRWVGGLNYLLAKRPSAGASTGRHKGRPSTRERSERHELSVLRRLRAASDRRGA